MLSSHELLDKFSVKVFENNFQYNYTSMTVSMWYITLLSNKCSLNFKTKKL